MSKTIDWTDSYNVCHWKLFPEEMVESTGYLECRENGMFENTTFFGLQAWIKQKLIAEDPSKMDVDDAEVSWNLHGDPFNREGWEYIKDLGYYPLEIQAVPEGSWIPRGNVITQIRSTDPKCSWLPNWVETELTQLWYPIVIATSDKYNKFMLWKHLEETGCENIPAVLPYMLHDFGYRGCTCREQAMIGGAAHLLNFEGSDTIAGSHYIRKYYGERMIGCSIPATNHAVITSYGKANEAKAFKKVLDTYLKPGAIVACVSDSYDIYNAVDIWGTEFKDQIINSGGRLVIRPDSGNPEYVLLACMTKLFKYFGYTETKTGHKLLPNYVRMIWGDGITGQRINEILYYMSANNIAAENFAFGMGGGMLQKYNRDSVSFAFKMNERRNADGTVDLVNKEPVTGKGKASKAGRQALVECDDHIFSIPENKLENRENLLRTVYLDGELLVDEPFSVIRERANAKGFSDYYGLV